MPVAAQTAIRLLWPRIGAALGIVALLLQASISIPAYLEEGLTLPLALLRYFTYLTIIANLAIVLIYLAATLPAARWLGALRTPAARATAAAMIALVMVYYHLFLAADNEQYGAAKTYDVLLHYAAPLVYLGWYALFCRSGSLTLWEIPWMLAVPAGYFIVVLLRGALTGEYPYDIVDVAEFGYAQVAVNVAMLAVVISILYAIAIGIDRLGARAA